MDTYTILILLSSLVIFSYLFDTFSRRTNVPSVLLLLLLGILIRYASVYFDIALYDFTLLLPLLGTVGLILIVFEGALELRYEARKLKLIKNAFGAALFLLLLTSASIAFIFYYFTEQSFYICLLNAIPFSVISSSIAIPSVISLQDEKKEFIIYESSFSDILGIMIFNFIMTNEHFSVSGLSDFGVNIFLVIGLSLLCCFFFLFMMGRVTHHVKFFLIISALILVYAIGKRFHLSTLVVVLAFGLFLRNSELIAEKLSRFSLVSRIKNYMIYPSLNTDLKSLHQLSAESAFILRTFFFLVFGYTLDFDDLFRPEVFFYGTTTIIAVYLLRWAYLRFIARAHLWPELLITPRGLISVLLFLSIPADMLLVPFENGILLYTIIFSGLLMTVGLIATGKKPTPSGDE
ncbi:MAG: cation:proton antiporter [Bacteroidota bacterium]|nr:cation:proton antiporter [Bacteroidota bacterium]